MLAFLKHHVHMDHLRMLTCESVDLGQVPRVCISNQQPGDVGAAGPGISLGVTGTVYFSLFQNPWSRGNRSFVSLRWGHAARKWFTQDSNSHLSDLESVFSKIMSATYFSAFSSALSWGLFAPLKLSGINWRLSMGTTSEHGWWQMSWSAWDCRLPHPNKELSGPKCWCCWSWGIQLFSSGSLVQNIKIHPDPLSGGHIVPLN